MCFPLPVSFRIWLGLLSTRTIEYRPYSLNTHEGFILEAARLTTGDLLIRIPHSWNSFMSCADLQHLMFRHRQGWSKHSAFYTPLFVSKETCTLNPITQSIEYQYDPDDKDTSPKSIQATLSSRMLHYVKSKKTKTHTSPSTIELYNSPGIMHALFVMHVQKDSSTSNRFRTYHHNLRPQFLTRSRESPSIASEFSFLDDSSGHSYVRQVHPIQETSRAEDTHAPSQQCE